MVKNPPSNAGNVGLIPGRGNKIPHAAGQLSPRDLKPEPQLERSPRAATKIPRAATKTRCIQINK